MSIAAQAQRELDRAQAAGQTFDKANGRDSSHQWNDFVPFELVTARLPFPVNCLPAAIHDAVTEYAAYGKQPMEMIASSALASVSICCQSHADVARDSRLVAPTSLAMIVVARSGERKTAADSAFSRAARGWISEKARDAREQRKAQVGEHAAWEEQLKGTRAALRKLYEQSSRNSSKPDSEKTNLANERENLERKIKELQEIEPRVCDEPELFYSDTTQQGLIKSMQDGLPFGALWEDEAGLLVGSVGMSKDNLLNFLATINKLWEAKPLKANRSSVENRSAEGKRFTVNLMMQPEVLDELLSAKNGITRGTGFIARMLICEPASTMGVRLYTEPGPMPAVDEFNRRVQALLDRPLPLDPERESELSPPVLGLSEKAKQLWVSYFNSIEKQIGNTGEFASIPDFASKSAEQAVRIAALFHVFEGREGDIIEADIMSSAIGIAAWYLSEAKRLLGAYELPRAVSDAKEVIDWMKAEGKAEVTTAEIGQNGPYATRTKARRDPALTAAISYGYLALSREGKKSTYHLNPLAAEAANECA